MLLSPRGVISHGVQLPSPFTVGWMWCGASVIMEAKRLTYLEADVPLGGFLIFCSAAEPVKLHRAEPAGLAFHQAALRLSGLLKEKKKHRSDGECEEEEKTMSSGSGSASVADGSSQWYDGKGKKSSTAKEGNTQDHYKLLGLGHLRYLATEDQIKKAYREVALKHHPDKQASVLLEQSSEAARDSKRQEIDDYFKAIQEAYEVLIDPPKRRLFDSCDEFDDEIPSDCCSEDFYKVFGPVFLRNGRWSMAQPCPQLGDDNTSMEDVDKFYASWYNFRSWREHPHADEFDVEQAESREHKRWMERQNAKLREKAKKEEMGRIRSMVETAYRRDPRIVRQKEAEKAEKIRRKHAKLQAKRAKEEEVARREEEERLRKEEEDRVQSEQAALMKKQRDKDKKLLRREKARLRAFTASLPMASSSRRPNPSSVGGSSCPLGRAEVSVSEEDVEKLCACLGLSQMKELCDLLEVEANEAKRVEMLSEAMTTLGRAAGDQQPTTSGGGGMDESSEDRVNGSVDQSESRDGLSDGAGREDRSKENMSAKENATAKETWSKEEMDLLSKGLRKFPKGTSRRWEVIGNYLGSRSVEEVLKMMKEQASQKPNDAKSFENFLQKRKPGRVVGATPDLADNWVDDGEDGRRRGIVDEDGRAVNVAVDEKGNGSHRSDGVSRRGAGAVSMARDGSPSAQGEDAAWTDGQDVALVKALKAFPKDTPQRWDRISQAVPGKAKAQCFKRFSELRENFRKRRSGVGDE